MAEKFHHIDSSAYSDFQEQAYAFEYQGDEKFKISIAVVNLSSLLLHPEYHNAHLFMQNVKEVCTLGRVTSSPKRVKGKHTMLDDYYLGHRRLFHDKYILKDKKPERYTVYTTNFDFSQPNRKLYKRLFRKRVIEEHLPSIPAISFASYGKKALGALELREGLAFYDYCKNDPSLSAPYKNMLAKKKQGDSAGSYVVYSSGSLVRSAFSFKDMEYEQLNLATSSFNRNRELSFVSVQDHHKRSGCMLPAVLTTPMSNPISELNRAQLTSFYCKGGKSIFCQAEVKDLMRQLNAYNAGYTDMCQKQPYPYKYRFEKVEYD